MMQSYACLSCCSAYCKPNYSYCCLIVERQHLKVISFFDCEDDAVTLVRLGLWPGSAVKPTAAFGMKLMDLATQLLLECQVLLLKFWNALASQHSDILPIHVSVLVLQ